jgi:hypothetical protein
MKNMGMLPALLAILVITCGFAGAEDEYKKYSRTVSEKVLAELTVSQDEWTFSVYIDDLEEVYSYAVSYVEHTDGRIVCGDEIEISADGLKFPNHFISADDIKRIDIAPGAISTETILTFLAVDEDQKKRKYKRRSSDRVSFFGNVTVEADEFIRGSVVSFFGDIEVYGEVNENVVAIFGDVYAGDGAVIRGDAISVSGKVSLDGKASVYGVIKSSSGKSTTRRHRARRWKDYHNTVNATGAFYYNRVDGAMIWAGARYDHADSLIPSFEALAGYAFSSSRWRYRLGLTQTLLRGPVPVQIGGRIFRQLQSDDDKLISESENSIFALLFNEDWKDYYEASGAYGFARVNILGWNTLEIGYLYEQQRWLDAHRTMWSLFGAKDFRDNFSSVPYDTLIDRRAKFNDRQVTSLIMEYTLDTRDDDKHPRSGWYGFARYEYSPGDWKGHYDFKRFETRLKRFQPLGEFISLDLTGAYGYAEGDLIHISRMFYLGGLGTIHGYRHKEYIGSEYVYLGGEYRFRIPHSQIAPFVLYDGGKVDGQVWVGGSSWYSSLGIGIDIDRSLRLFMSKRLDRSGDNPVFYARFSYAVM